MKKKIDSNYSQIGRIFHENTKHYEEIVSKAPSSTYELYPKKKVYFPLKVHDVKFPKVNNEFISTLFDRKSYEMLSVRTHIEITTALSLLSMSYTVESNLEEKNKSIRTVPSAGGRYPNNIYLIVFNIKKLNKGIYYWNHETSTLNLLKEGDFRGVVKECISETNNFDIEFCSFITITTAEIEKTLEKYGARGYRYIYLDAGHISQNLYLVSNYLGLACKAIGGFFDDRVSDFLQLEKDEVAITIHIFGREFERTHLQLNLDFNKYFHN